MRKAAGDRRLSYYEITTAPASEPVTVAECKLAARFTASALDTLIEDVYIPAARGECQHRTGQSIGAQTVRKTIDAWPVGDDIDLSYGPVSTVTSVQYLDADGDAQTVSASLYSLDNRGAGQSSKAPSAAWVVLAADQMWPDVGDYANAVTVTYVAGYTTCPANLRAWIICAVAEMIRTGSLDIPRDFCAGLLDSHSVMGF